MCVKGHEEFKSAFWWNDHLKIFSHYLAISLWSAHITNSNCGIKQQQNKTKQKTNQTEQTKHLNHRIHLVLLGLIPEASCLWFGLTAVG